MASESGSVPSSSFAAPTPASGGEPMQTEGAPTIGSGTGMEGPENIEDEAVTKKQKKSTSPVWDHYTRTTKTVEVNGKKIVERWAQCNHCKYNARCETINGTSCFWNHLKKKHHLNPGQQVLKVEKDNEFDTTIVEPYRYDQEASLRKFYLAIIMHEYPFNIAEHEYFVDFIKSLRPTFPIKSRTTIRKEIMDLFLQEKGKLYEYFKTIQCRFSTTMDMWTSNQNKGYMCVTVHWIDDNWQIQKRIIKFMHVEGRHTGANLSDAFTSCAMRWNIEKKLFSLSLDNASANEVCVKDVLAEIKKQSPLICDGMFFHVRCANHILNLVARDGLQEIASAVQNIRAFVLAVKGSPLQWEEFQKCASECGLDTKMSLSLDVATRWNSTYLMLRDAIYYRSAFERLLCLERRRYEKIAPLDSEWDMALTLCKCLKKFYDVTELFSGTLYPTANLFYHSFCQIKLLISEWCASSDTTIRDMAFSMSAKFDKYWKKSNIALAVATFLDPRYKTKIIEFYMKKFFGELLYKIELEDFINVVKQLYESYASVAPSVSKSKTVANATSTLNHKPAIDLFMDNENDELHDFLYDTSGADENEPNDLEKYMAEQPLKFGRSSQNFDILLWWKNQQDEYPILSRVARDVLAMQVSTVASESAFSAGGHVIDPFRSRLEPEMVEALICTKDWIAASRKDSKSKVASIISDLEVVETIVANMRILQDEEVASDGELL